MDLIAFLNQRKALSNKGDTEGLKALEQEASGAVRAFLDGKIGADTDRAPLFYSFLKTFSQTDNPDLKKDCDKALIKIQPYLDQFDKENGLTRLDDLSKNVIEHNLDALSVFEQLYPFEMKKENQLKFPIFSDLFRLTNSIDITDDKGQVTDQAHARFVDTLIDAARLQTFMKLSISVNKITEDIYLDDLRQNMEVGLVSMFVIDRIPSDRPIDEETKDLIQAEYQKLLNSI